MTKKPKRWSEMTTAELAAATKEFDDPNYHPVARKPSKRALAQLRRVQRKDALSSFRIALVLDKQIVEQIDTYAASHGVTFSDVITTAVEKLLQKKTA